MKKVLPLAVGTEPTIVSTGHAQIILFPETRRARWLRELRACRDFHDSAWLVHRMIREMEREDKIAALRAKLREEHQLAFSFGR